MTEESEVESAVEPSGPISPARRQFLTRLAVGTAFVVPTVTALSLSNASKVYAVGGGGSMGGDPPDL